MGKIAWQILGVGGTALATLAARKALGIVWEKTTSKPVPINTEDDQVGLSEALAWTIISGVGIAVAQLVVQRYAASAVRNRFGETALPKKLQKGADVD
ncbi:MULTISPECIES: DUF4235 domain-containing protein [Brevibacterium]|uniref:DUF4235 domain-containing protein n=1 Tax=Brevibacterium luteolum TaxID=199591 RepID=A0A2N6PG51_9MICO|nr:MULTISPECIES: DUF4235 domain-containing protein [Brevibacterium]MBM7529900.1 type IV secretory pathway TrbF-like protein [Brevibacterium luteolum]MCT1658271.1 DUF4235 domain-containing protein [Brevibacterium luteolum]MCT1872491.1 DUF4235 domain-containing protein [Brevibacterium luteolum]MCT1890231.1 DUF4235 domain-containing protein [Brevibacterium luteolum]MCT1892751.1 DUF4235 domain-containing protein [Brevibacterium luteolum]